MTLSYLEIYNENIRDLLKPSSGTLDLREDAKKGTIEVGKLADIIAVPGNPLEDIQMMKKVGFVMKGGKIYKVEN